MTYSNYLLQKKKLQGNKKDCQWEQRIINTKLKCYGKTSTKAKELVKKLDTTFLDNLKIKDHLDSMVFAFLLNKVKDFKAFKIYLDKYVKTIDNWASCDTIKFSKFMQNDILLIAKQYLKSSEPFVKRVGINCYFELLKTDEYLPIIFSTLDNLSGETNYYVNMAGAFLLSVCFVKHKKETIKYFQKNNASQFLINKAISKCRDSFRVNNADKELLIKFRK